MGLLLSRRILPGIRLDLFAAFLDSARHGVEIGGINATSEAHEVPDWCSCGFGQAAREIQNLALVRSGQAVHLLDNFVFDGLCHDEINVGKGILKVKGAHIVALLRAGIPRILALVLQSQEVLVVDFH